MPSTEELLKRHKPVLKYDSQEVYFADSAAEWTDNPGNVLLDASGQTVAVAGEGLDLALLAKACKDGTATDNDVISDPARDYQEQARRLHAQNDYRNRVYGRAMVEGDVVWLQYWFFYFYNDYNLIGTVLKAGLHEGDWEMVELRLPDEQGAPDLAVYAQHAHAAARPWNQVDLVPGTEQPLVYPARGSHASYFEPGTHWTGYWFDHADGKRRSPDLDLKIVRDGQDEWLWIRWPGYWGDTKKGEGSPLDSDSPRGPGHHEQWDQPSVLLSKPPPPRPTAAPSPPPAPAALAEWAGAALRIHYNVQPDSEGRQPSILTATINSPDDPAPPTTRSFEIEYRSGTVELKGDVERTRRYDIYLTCATTDEPPLVSASTRLDVPPSG
jgi:hypothetical protein